MFHNIGEMCRSNSNNCLLSGWKGPAFMITSGFLVCCELYGWTTSGVKSSPQESYGDGEEKEASVRNGAISEEDFPTIHEWLDDRDVLYKERSRCVQSLFEDGSQKCNGN